MAQLSLSSEQPSYADVNINGDASNYDDANGYSEYDNGQYYMQQQRQPKRYSQQRHDLLPPQMAPFPRYAQTYPPQQMMYIPVDPRTMQPVMQFVPVGGQPQFIDSYGNRTLSAAAPVFTPGGFVPAPYYPQYAPTQDYYAMQPSYYDPNTAASGFDKTTAANGTDS
jgi:hypothetical protein